MKVIFEPHTGPQRKFMTWSGRYALYGGAANSGKSECLRWYPFRQIQVESERKAAGEIESSIGRAIIFRRTMPELRELMDRCARDFKLIDTGANWHEQTKTWTFSCGYKLMLAQMEEEKDWIKYYGFEFTFVGWDELTTFTEEQYDQLDSRLRTKDPVLAKMLWNRAGTNPVGIGVEWVRRRFVEAGPANRTLVRRVPVEVVDDDGGKRIEVVERSQIFIPASVNDNKSVDATEYKATLLSKGASSTMVRQLLHGDWYVVQGAWIGDLWDPAVHVCKPFKIPLGWYKFRSCDYGFTAPASVSWWAVDKDGNMTCYRNLTVTKHNAEMLAYRIKELELENGEWDVSRGCSMLSGPLDNSCWSQTGTIGPTIAETMMLVGVNWFKSTKDRHAAADQLRWRLMRRTGHPTIKDEKGNPALIVPGIRWFSTCKEPIRTIPALPCDKNDPEVPDTDSNDHNYDDTTYACMSRPLVPSNDNTTDDFDDIQKARQKRTARLGYAGIG